MKNQSFLELNSIEKKAKLLKILIQKTKGKLEKRELSKIIDNLSDINKQYKIEVIPDSKEFASKFLTEKDIGIEHSWAGERFGKSKCKVLLYGSSVNLEKIKLGKDYQYEYFDNGNSTGLYEEEIIPDFDINKKIAVEYYERDYSDYNNDYYDEKKYTIAIYLPNDCPYAIEKDIKAIIETFGLK